MKKLFSMLGILALTVGLTACNTFRGMGEDIESGGEKMQGTASEAQQQM